MSIPEKAVQKFTLTIGGIPCTIAQIVAKPGKSGATATFHAIRGVHSVQAVMDAYKLAMKRAGAVKTDWTDEVVDREDVGKNHRSGAIHGFQWVADWSTGCAVYLITGPEYRHRVDVVTACTDLRKYFEQRLKTVPDSLEVIRHTDRRARELEPKWE